MSITEKQRQQQQELHKRLWSIANDLRGNMDASEFRNYILGLIFYRFLSEKAEAEVADALADEDVTYEKHGKMMNIEKILKKNFLKMSVTISNPKTYSVVWLKK